MAEWSDEQLKKRIERNNKELAFSIQYHMRCLGSLLTTLVLQDVGELEVRVKRVDRSWESLKDSLDNYDLNFRHLKGQVAANPG